MDEEECKDDELDDILEEQWKLQDQIHKKCKIKDNAEDKIKKWKEKYS
jgi:hypothetical protein